jgi:NMD protein affecting ribosome stability and mRNA decay
MSFKCENCQKETPTLYYDRLEHKWLCEDCYFQEDPEQKVIKETGKKPLF